MCSKSLSQSEIQKVGRRVVGCDLEPALHVNLQGEGLLAVCRNPFGYVDRKVVLLDCVEDLDLLAALGDDDSGVAHLSAHLRIERCAVEDQLEHSLVLLLHGTLLEKLHAIKLEVVVAEEGLFLTVIVDRPVPELVGCGVTRPVLLLLELLAESLHINSIAFLRSDQLSQVDRESVGIVEDEGVLSRDCLRGGVLGDVVVHQSDSAVESPQEGHLLLTDHALNQFLLFGDLRIGLSHISHKLRHQRAEERLVEPEERVAVAYRAAQDPSDDIAGLHVGRQLTVGDGESDGPDVVCDDSHRHLGLFALVVSVSGKFLDPADHS